VKSQTVVSKKKLTPNGLSSNDILNSQTSRPIPVLKNLKKKN